MSRLFILGSVVFMLASTAIAADKQKQAVIKAAEADADFAVQGEYTGEVETDDGPTKLGVQVIALGDGKFDAVAYPGGLPGDGWNGVEKIRAKGETQGSQTLLTSKESTGVINDGKLTISNKDGATIGTLKKTTRKSSTMGDRAPIRAVVLFNGRTANKFEGGKLTDDGFLEQGITSKQKFGSFKLHMEFKLSYMPYARGQGRSNSGCYMQGRYEVQILDSFGLEGKNNECGGIYTIKDAAVNMCFPPLSWQTYDVEYTQAKYDSAGKKTENARMTVRHNGVLVQDDVELPNATRGAPVKEGPEPGPIYIQDHSNPVRFRNIWLVEK